jgi:hypothetical protein
MGSASILMFKIQLRAWYWTTRWKLSMWLASWRLDEDGDLALVLCNRLALVKYKQSTMVHWIKGTDWPEAPKRLNLSRHSEG